MLLGTDGFKEFELSSGMTRIDFDFFFRGKVFFGNKELTFSLLRLLDYFWSFLFHVFLIILHFVKEYKFDLSI